MSSAGLSRCYRAVAEKAPAADRGLAYLDVGRAAEKANRTPKAIDAYRLALESSPQREVPLLRLGKLNARQGRTAEAATQLNEAGQLFQLASNYEGVTETKLELARMYESFNLVQAESQTRSAIETARLTGNAQQQVKSRFELSRVKLLQGHAGEAASIAEDAIGLAEGLHLENLSVQGLNDLAAVMTRQLKWKEVEALCQRAIVLAKRSTKPWRRGAGAVLPRAGTHGSRRHARERSNICVNPCRSIGKGAIR